MGKDFKQAFVRLQTKDGVWRVHPDLRHRLIADAEEEGTNLSAVVIRILADKHGVDCAANGRRAAAKEENALIFNVRLPWPLYAALQNAATRRGVDYQDVIRADLCAHYGLEAPVAAAA